MTPDPAHNQFRTVLADPPWQFRNKGGKGAPEHKRLRHYPTVPTDQMTVMPLADRVARDAHLYLWVPNAMLADGLHIMAEWGFDYKTNLIWCKCRSDGEPERRGMGFYFRNATEILLFGVRGRLRTLSPARSRHNVLRSMKRRHSQKPDEQYELIEACSPGPYLELFARSARTGWTSWGDEINV